MSVEISGGVIFHQSENNHRQAFFPHQPLPNDAPQEVLDAAAQLWTQELIDSWLSVFNPTPTLSEAIATKVNQIKEYYQALSEELSYGGYLWQTDDKAILRITATKSALDSGLATDGPTWRTLNNEMVAMDVAAFTQFAGAVLVHQRTTFYEMVGHIDAVRALTKVEAVNSYAY